MHNAEHSSNSRPSTGTPLCQPAHTAGMIFSNNHKTETQTGKAMVRPGWHFFLLTAWSVHNIILLLLCGQALTNENKSFPGQQVQLLAPSPQTAASLPPAISSFPPSLFVYLSFTKRLLQGDVMLAESTQTWCMARFQNSVYMSAKLLTKRRSQELLKHWK